MREGELDIVRAATLQQRMARAGAPFTSTTDILLRAAARSQARSCSRSDENKTRLGRLFFGLVALVNPG